MVFKSSRQFPGGSVVRTLQSHCRGTGQASLEAKYDTGYY